MIKDPIFNDYLIILFNPLSWNIIVLWHLLLGTFAYFLIQKKLARDKVNGLQYLFLEIKYVGFGFFFEMLKGIFYVLICYYFYYIERYLDKTTFMSIDIDKTIYSLGNSGFSIAEIILMIFSVFTTLGFWFIIRFFILKKFKISVKHKVIMATVLSVFSGAYYILYL